MRISVLGLGSMGAPMARNLIAVGHDVALYDRNHDLAVKLVTKGARAAASVADAVREAHVALTMVPGDEAVESITYGDEGLLQSLPPGAIHLCMSTISVELSRKLSFAHAEAKQGYVAAPVFGRPGAAALRHLWIIAAGPDLQVNRCLALFEALGRGTTRVGTQAELAHALKLGGDMLALTVVEGLSETLVFGEKAGMAPAEYLRLLNTAIFKSPLLDAYGGLIVRKIHEPADLSLDSALRETRAIQQASGELGTSMPVVELLQQRLEAASFQGWGDLDLTVLSRYCRMCSGLEQPATDAPGYLDLVEQKDPSRHFKVRSSKGEMDMDLDETTHFEFTKNAVWAWSHGKHYNTPWKQLSEVERTFSHVPFLRLQDHILLNPKAVLAHNESSQEKANAADTADSEGGVPPPVPSVPTFPALDGERHVMLDLATTTHFEMKKKTVWAWSQGKRYQTQCPSLREVQSMFQHVILLRVQPKILLNPESVVALKQGLLGRAKVKVRGDMMIRVSRAAVPRLKELLGI